MVLWRSFLSSLVVYFLCEIGLSSLQPALDYMVHFGPLVLSGPVILGGVPRWCPLALAPEWRQQGVVKLTSTEELQWKNLQVLIKL